MAVDFDPNGLGIPNGNFAGFETTLATSKIVFIPVRWDATVSFKEGARFGPDAILAASPQLAVYDEDYPDAWKEAGIFWHDVLPDLGAPQVRESAQKCIAHLTSGGKSTDPEVQKWYAQVNDANVKLATALKGVASGLLEQGKIVCVVGGDHSTPLGLMHAVAEHHGTFSVLHIDAHFDLYNAFEGFPMSHASIMFNASKIGNIDNFAHVGIRSSAPVEAEFVETSNHRHELFSDRSIQGRMFCGETWSSICKDIVSELGDRVYVSFDIDGLTRSNGPDTGTSVPSGLQFEQAMYLINHLVDSGKTIVGFDLVEVAPASPNPSTWEGDWNAIVGSSALLRLAYMTHASQIA